MDLTTVLTAITGVAGSLAALFKYFNYKSRRDRMAEVGRSFGTVIEALASQDEVKQLSAAILLRRFFDPHTEFGAAGTPYANEAVNVIASMLRSDSLSEKMQKLLADGLAYAPDLRYADLQKANLADAYLGQGIDCSGADFFDADLTRASLKRLTGVRTVFYGATLHKTVLEGADLRGANFTGADLQGVKIDDRTRLDGAMFDGARNVPTEVRERLDSDGTYPGVAPDIEIKASGGFLSRFARGRG